MTIPITPIEKIGSKRDIQVKGARVHNLKNISVNIPRNKLVVVTGLSGSGKSSLAFDTLYAEGQRRYIESLSSYVRQFLGKLDKPDVDNIIGISPAIAIEQKVSSSNPRSTVGTSTEIYDYLKLLYARIGKTFSPISGNEVKRDTIDDVIQFLNALPNETPITLYSPLIVKENRDLKEHLSILFQQGFSRVKHADSIYKIEEIPTELVKQNNPNVFKLLIDRFSTNKDDEDTLSRMTDSTQTAFYEGDGAMELEYGKEKKTKSFSNLFELDEMSFEEPNIHFFSFNSPAGACKTCEGFGSIVGIDDDLVIPDKNLSVYDDAIVCWRGEKMGEWKNEFVRHAHKFDFPVHRSISELTEAERQLLWKGNKYFNGLNDFFKHLEEQSYKIQYRVMLSRYRGKTTCPDCRGTRLRKDASYVKVADKSIQDILILPISDLLNHFKSIELNEYQKKVASRILLEISSRLQFLEDVGLGYLTLNRLSGTLSGGESQRINLATSIGSSLVGSMYILDEPSIGLHSRDTLRLIKVLKSLRDLGNTVIVVEHDEEIMQAADYIIDLGPMAGSLGGEIVFSGNHQELILSERSLTAQYLTGRESIAVPSRRKWKYKIDLLGACENNLKNINVSFPLEVFTVVTGVSGSGKTTLIKRILYPALKKMFGGYGEKTGKFSRIDGDYKKIKHIEFVDQNPIGRSSRSNPVTYIKAYDEIRTLYATQQISKVRGYKPSHFSFNVDGGRCESCEGEGSITIEMQFMADVHMVCEECGGKRFKEEVLEVMYRDKTISEILALTIDDAILFFREDANNKQALKVAEKLMPLQQVGLGYIQMGQSSSTLSGGEAQRIKLASFLGKGNDHRTENVLFIFDEPSTGLHFHDIKKLLEAFQALIEQGHTILVIEHHLDIIKSADWIIDLGPDSGDKGGQLVFEGTPEGLVESSSLMAKYLKEKCVPSLTLPKGGN